MSLAHVAPSEAHLRRAVRTAPFRELVYACFDGLSVRAHRPDFEETIESVRAFLTEVARDRGLGSIEEAALASLAPTVEDDISVLYAKLRLVEGEASSPEKERQYTDNLVRLRSLQEKEAAMMSESFGRRRAFDQLRLEAVRNAARQVLARHGSPSPDDDPSH